MNAATHPAPYLAERAKRDRVLVTPEGIALPLRLATRTSRAGAVGIDLLIIFVGYTAMTLLLLWIAFGLLDLDEIEAVAGTLEMLAIVWLLAGFVLLNGYFMMLELRPRGATLGKRLVGIRVASRDGGRLTPEAVVARNLIRQIELFLPLAFLDAAPEGDMGLAGIVGAAWFLIFLLLPFFNRDALRAGDIIAGTWVVEAPRARLDEALSTQGVAQGQASALTGTAYTFSDEELAVYGEYELQTLERVLREDRAEAVSAVHETICRKIGWNPGGGDERAFLEAFYAQLRARLEGGMRFGRRKADKFSEAG